MYSATQDRGSGFSQVLDEGGPDVASKVLPFASPSAMCSGVNDYQTDITSPNLDMTFRYLRVSCQCPRLHLRIFTHYHPAHPTSVVLSGRLLMPEPQCSPQRNSGYPPKKKTLCASSWSWQRYDELAKSPQGITLALHRRHSPSALLAYFASDKHH